MRPNNSTSRDESTSTAGSLTRFLPFVPSTVDYLYTYLADSNSDASDTPTENFKHFTSIIEGFATLLPNLRFLQWEFQELYTVVWDIERGEDGKPVVEGSLLCDELDDLPRKEEEGSDGDEDDEEGWDDVDV